MFWSGLREQIKTVDNCFYRSECAETRSNGSEACSREQYDYVSSARTRRTSIRGSWWERRPLSALYKIKKPYHLGTVFYFGADYGARTRHLHLGKVALYQMS